MLSGLLIDPAFQCVSMTSAVYQTLLSDSGAVWETSMYIFVFDLTFI